MQLKCSWILDLSRLQILQFFIALIIIQPMLHEMLYTEWFVVILVVITADFGVVWCEMNVEIGRQLLYDTLMEVGKLFFLFIRATRSDANDISGLIHFVGKEEEHK